MTNWPRLLLVTLTVGGGFAGFAGTLTFLFHSDDQPRLNLVIAAAFLALYVYVTASGLHFVSSAQNTRPLFFAIAIQVPWFSFSSFAYKFAAGFQTLLGLAYSPNAGVTFKFSFFVGSDWYFSIAQGNPFILGINVWAVAMLALLWKSTRAPRLAVQPVISEARPNSGEPPITS